MGTRGFRPSAGDSRRALIALIAIAGLLGPVTIWSPMAQASDDTFLEVDIDGCDFASALLAADLDMAVGGCPAGSGHDTIVLLDGDPFDELLGSAFDIKGPLTIRGGTDTVIDVTNGPASVFNVVGTDLVRFEGFTIKGAGGGAIGTASDWRGRLDIVDMTFRGNQWAVVASGFGTTVFDRSLVVGGVNGVGHFALGPTTVVNSTFGQLSGTAIDASSTRVQNCAMSRSPKARSACAISESAVSMSPPAFSPVTM